MTTNWKKLANIVYKEDITEEGLLDLIKEEKSNRNRKHILIRLYGRFNKLRSKREREALLEDAK